MHALQPLIKATFLLGVFLLGMGCSSTQSVAPTPTEPATESQATGETPRTVPSEAPESVAEVEAALRQVHAEWQGTPHRLGGTSKRGVDCSGLLYLVFPAVLHTHLPRTTEEQARMGRSVRQSNLQAGDLVFFRPNRKTRHVGVYLRDGEFLHAPNSGVRVDRLDDPYWNRAYWMARRVLDAEDPRQTAGGNAPAQTSRAGW